MILPLDAEAFGVYVHVPFCSRRCDYCAFATWTDRDHLMGDYVDVVVADIERSAPAVRPATSVFFGGGTPSLLPIGEIGRIVGALTLAPAAEVTVECNPDTVSAELLASFRSAGVNRLSFGVQSMVDRVLLALGRTHDRANVARAVAMATAEGFDRINLDLIYGAAGETMADWRDSLDAVIGLGVSHVSAYALTVEAGTPLAADASRHPDDDDQADKYLLAEELLVGAGLSNYEISNWARPGEECRHNWLYWGQGEYHAYGCAAHGYRDGVRWWNVRTPERYVAAIRSDADADAVASSEQLDAEGAALEGLQLALRTRHGVPVDAFEPDELAELRSNGLVSDQAGGRVALTVHGAVIGTGRPVR